MVSLAHHPNYRMIISPGFTGFPFFFIVSVGVIWMVIKPTHISLPFLKHEVPAYYVIEAKDVLVVSVDASIVNSGTVRNIQDLIGHYTFYPVHPYRPINNDQIGPKPNSTLISNTLAIALPANITTLLAGNIYAGDVVSLATVHNSNTNSSSTIVFQRVLVLDRKSVGSQNVIVLAIPIDRWLDYLDQTRNATIVLARQVE